VVQAGNGSKPALFCPLQLLFKLGFWFSFLASLPGLLLQLMQLLLLHLLFWLLLRL
jgi:hypothetical protein